MLVPIICLLIISGYLFLAEELWQHNILHGEAERKFVHVGVGSFVAFWPWLMSFRWITVIGLVLLAAVLANRLFRPSHLLGEVHRPSIGDFLLPGAIIICSLLTHHKIFFAVAMLHLSWADGLAALVGENYIRRWGYRVLGQVKTVIGSMTFWVVSIAILGLAGPFMVGLISYSHYATIILVLPLILTELEAIGVFGLDNLLVPVAVVLALRLAQS